MGYQKALNQEDIWDLAERDQAAKVSKEFSDVLTSDPHKGSVFRSMWQKFRGPFLKAGLIKLVHDAILFTGKCHILDLELSCASHRAVSNCA